MVRIHFQNQLSESEWRSFVRQARYREKEPDVLLFQKKVWIVYGNLDSL
jgi:hypothetical protein